MIWVSLSVLLASTVAVPPAPPLQRSFEQISRQAEEARSADRLPDAIRFYREGVKLRPSWSEGWWGLGSILYEQDRFPEAVEAFSQFVATSKKEVAPAYAFLGLCEYETRDYRKATEHLSTWVQKGMPGNVQLIEVASFHWALLLTRGGFFVQSLFLLEEKAKRYGVSPQVVEAMGLASLQMRNLPEDCPPEKREMVWLAGQASVYGSLHDFDRAHEFAGRLASHYGNEPNVHYLHGNIYGFEQRTEEAGEEYRQELKLSPENASAMIQLSFVDLLESRLDEAVPMARRAVALLPKDPLSHYALGRVLLASGEFQESVRHLETAKELAPTSAKIRYQLSVAYRRLGRKADAARESDAFEAMKDKNEILAAPDEKPQPNPKQKAGIK